MPGSRVLLRVSENPNRKSQAGARSGDNAGALVATYVAVASGAQPMRGLRSRSRLTNAVCRGMKLFIGTNACSGRVIAVYLSTDGQDSYRLAQATAGKGVRPLV
jgi:hypothetical protein